MEKLEALRQSLPDFAKDLRLNLQSVLQSGSLGAVQRWEVALACAQAIGEPRLLEAVREAAASEVDDAVADDARAAAALMAMNNIFYRFRHMIGREAYSTRPAGLRMSRVVRPRADKLDFELACLAVSAINGCEACLQAHEKVVIGGGLTEDNVHDAVRIAATLNGVAAALRE